MANNHICLVRTYRHCGECQDNVFPVDKFIGIGSGYTDGAKRLITYAIGTLSYRHAADMLKEFGCFHLPHQTVGGVAVEVAAEIEAKLKDNPAVRKEFQAAKGDTEFVTDGAFVNTRNDDGHEWREMKVAIIAKRERGESALPEEWDSRDLPEPTVSAAAAAIETDGSVLVGRTGEPNRVDLCRSLLKPVETRLEYSINTYKELTLPFCVLRFCEYPDCFSRKNSRM